MAFIEPTATSGISVWVPIGGSSGLLCLLFTILMWAEVKPPWSRQHREKAVSLQNKGKIVWVSWLLTFSLVLLGGTAFLALGPQGRLLAWGVPTLLGLFDLMIWFVLMRPTAAPPSLEFLSPLRRSVYDVVRDCTMGDDPPGPWKYGYSQGVGNAFHPFNARHSDAFAGVDRWFCPEIDLGQNMGVMHNRTNHTVAGVPRTYTIRADMMHMHPGEGGYCAVIRWQCPEDGIYVIQGSCDGLDKQEGADPVVHIMRNSVELWQTALVGGVPSAETFSLPKVFFESGDTLDFVVSQGATWGADSVGLKATIRKYERT